MLSEQVPQTGRLKTRAIHSLVVLEARRSEVKVSAGPRSRWRLQGRSRSMWVSGSCVAGSPGTPWPADASL